MIPRRYRLDSDLLMHVLNGLVEVRIGILGDKLLQGQYALLPLCYHGQIELVILKISCWR